MKRLFLLLLAMLLMVGIPACQKIKDNINNSTKTTVRTDIIVPLSANIISNFSAKNDIVFLCETQYHIPDNETIRQYQNKIKDLDVIGIQIKVISVKPADMILKNATFTLQQIDNTHLFESHITKDFPLTLDNIYVVNENDATWEIANDIIDDLGDIKLKANGLINSKPNEYNHLSFEYIIKVKATVSTNL